MDICSLVNNWAMTISLIWAVCFLVSTPLAMKEMKQNNRLNSINKTKIFSNSQVYTWWVVLPPVMAFSGLIELLTGKFHWE